MASNSWMEPKPATRLVPKQSTATLSELQSRVDWEFGSPQLTDSNQRITCINY